MTLPATSRVELDGKTSRFLPDPDSSLIGRKLAVGIDLAFQPGEDGGAGGRSLVFAGPVAGRPSLGDSRLPDLRLPSSNRLTPEHCQGGTKPAGVFRGQIVHDGPKNVVDIIDVWAARPDAARIRPVPLPCIRVTHVGAPVAKRLFCCSWPQACAFQACEHRAPARRQPGKLRNLPHVAVVLGRLPGT